MQNGMRMIKASFRFYAELNDLLPMDKRAVTFELEFPPGQTVKHMIESSGVPHTEVDLILANGEPVNFFFQLQQGDRVSVYPIFETLDITSLVKLRPEPLRVCAFVLDCHLGRLAAYLRLLGLDVLYRNDYSDEELAEISEKAKRICITRDRGLLKRKQISHGCLIHSLDPREQALEVVRRFQLEQQLKPFTRCVKCNGLLQEVHESEIADQLLPGTRENYHDFAQCAQCGKLFWKGSHYNRLLEFIAYVQ
jgi:hypothetical protein